MDLVLATHVPHGKADVLILPNFHVETYGADGGHDLTQLQFVQDGDLLPHSIQVHCENIRTCISLLPQKALEEAHKDSPYAVMGGRETGWGNPQGWHGGAGAAAIPSQALALLLQLLSLNV